MRSSIRQPSRLRAITLATHQEGRNRYLVRWLDPRGRAVGQALALEEWPGVTWWVEAIDWVTTPTALAEVQGTARQTARHADRRRAQAGEGREVVERILPVPTLHPALVIPETPPEALERQAPLQQARRVFPTYPTQLGGATLREAQDPARGPHADLATRLRNRFGGRGRALSSGAIERLLEAYLRERTYLGAARVTGLSNMTVVKYCRHPEVVALLRQQEALLTSDGERGETPPQAPSADISGLGVSGTPAVVRPAGTQPQLSSDERTAGGAFLSVTL